MLGSGIGELNLGLEMIRLEGRVTNFVSVLGSIHTFSEVERVVKAKSQVKRSMLRLSMD